MTRKNTGLTIVLLLAFLVALGSGLVVFALGATPRAAFGTAGAAFLGIASLGVQVLRYLLPEG
ncbi:hypothetical protein [Streptomyces sp. 900105755]